jgi:hypothetical protein
MNRPQTHEYPIWAETYIKLVDGDVLELLERQAAEFSAFVSDLIEKADYAYAPGKWTLKELVGHIIDAERVLVYRLTCFVRGDNQMLPGFDEDEYVAYAHFDERSMLTLSEEFRLLRKSNLYLFKSIQEADLDRPGNANNKQITVRAMLYVIAGHITHHTMIIKERYLD